MKKISLQFYSLIGVFLLSSLFATVLYQKSQIDYQSHSQQMTLVHSIQESSSQLTRDLILIKEGEMTHYDEVIQRVLKIDRLIHTLPPHDLSKKLLEKWQILKEHIETVKSNNAIYRNSLLYFPKGITELSLLYKDKPKYQSLVQSLFNLERYILRLNSHYRPLKSAIEAVEVHIKALPPEEDTFVVRMLLKHAAILSNNSVYQSALYKELLRTNIQEVTKELLSYYNNEFQQQINQTNQIKKVFYIICISLIAAIILALHKLKKLFLKVQKSERLLRQVSDNAPIMLWMSNKQGFLEFVNGHWENNTQQRIHQNIFSENYYLTIHPKDRDKLKAAYVEQENQTTISTFQYRTIDIKTGETQSIFLTHIIAKYSSDNCYDGLICSTIDISEQKKLEEEINLAANVFKHSIEGILISNAHNEIVQVNQAFKDLTGYSEAEVLGNTPSMLSSGLQSKAFYNAMWTEIKTQGLWRGEILNCRKNGQIYPEWLTIIALKNQDNVLTHHIAIFRDITEKKRAEQDIHFLAHFDSLTRLPNRSLFYERAEAAIRYASKNQECIAILFLDLDRFKAVNDAFGHDTGDELLIAVAKDLKNAVRDVDLVARIGGDEFTIILEGLSHEVVKQDVKRVAEKIIQQLSSEYMIKNTSISIGVSIGVSIYPTDCLMLDSMLQYADMAMYHAKEQGRNNVQFYSKELNDIIQKKLRLEADLKVALEDGQLFLQYQPQYNLTSQKIEGFEALIRWNHPEKGLIPPDEFISIAEDSGLILDIGDWVLKTACMQLQQWHQKFSPILRIAVNVSIKQLEKQGFIEHVSQVLEQTKLNPASLEIEVTESIFLEEGSTTHQILNQLDQLGVQISMDDFGTGYSNMAYLKKLPIDRIKIDRCFISDILEDESDAAITCAIIDIARHFNIKVIAEGIEHQAQAEFLLQQGCDEGQGFFFSKPLSVEEIDIMLAKKNAY